MIHPEKFQGLYKAFNVLWFWFYKSKANVWQCFWNRLELELRFFCLWQSLSMLAYFHILSSWSNFRYYNCVHGFPHMYECPPPLIFDEAQGTCVREDQASSFAKKCEAVTEKESIEGFSCPEGDTLGPNGQPLAHPSFPHPTSCRNVVIKCHFL